MSSEETPALPKKWWSKRKKIIASTIPVILIVLLAWYVTSPKGITSCEPGMGATEHSTATNYTFTISYMRTCGSPAPLKSDVYVQVKNAIGIMAIYTTQLASASGTQGFNYTPASTGDRLSVGDVFSLDRTLYAYGSTIALVMADGMGQYAIFQV